MPSLIIVFYVLTPALIYLCANQRSKEEETLTRKNVIILPLLTIIAYFSIFGLVTILNTKLLNLIIFVLFIHAALLSTISNILYMLEVTELELFRYNESSEIYGSFNELRLNSSEEQKIQRGNQTHDIYHLFGTTYNHLIAYTISLILCVAFALTKSDTIELVLCLSICFGSSRILQADSVVTAIIMLAILIVYDILWLLFGESTISTLIRNKVRFPIRIFMHGGYHSYEIIGFGDIFIPAIYLNMLKRYSLGINDPWSFNLSFIGMCIGIFISYAIFAITVQKSPSLIITCPILICTSVLYEFYKGRLGIFLHYRQIQVCE